jgi:2-methylcitrate dehydratase PrpD
VKVVVDPEFEGSRSVTGPVKIKLTMKDGKELYHRVELARGHPRNQMSELDFIEKFNDCATRSARPLSRQNIERLLGLLNELEKVDDISKVVRLLT